MRRATLRNMVLGGLAFVLTVATTIVVMREPMVPLTLEGLEAARMQWRSAGADRYQMIYRMNGDDYAIRCIDGIVTEVQVNGQDPHGGDWRAYSVNGLFDTLDRELENVSDPSGPFAGRQQAVLLRVRFHGELGYVERFLRSSGGLGRGASIEILEFDPSP